LKIRRQFEAACRNSVKNLQCPLENRYILKCSEMLNITTLH